MFRSQILITLRTLWRDKGYTSINILGLSVAIACGIIVTLYIEDELGFDRMHSKADRIYRAVELQSSPEGTERLIGSVMGPVGPAVASTVPEVETTVRMLSRQSVGRRAIGSGPNRVYEGDYLFVEPSFFDVFDFHLVSGDPKTALVEPRSVVLTETAARKHFGDKAPVGENLEVEGFEYLKVTGLVQDPPPNSHLSFSMLISLSSALSHPAWLAWSNRRSSEGFITYVVLKDGADFARVQPVVERVSASLADTQSTAIRSFFLQPLTEVHFGSNAIEFDRNQGKSDRRTLLIFGAVGLFVILIACVNYTNLATARSMRRAREVGIRKVSGAHRAQLFRQFLGESFSLTAFAFLLALLLQKLLLPYFNDIAGKSLALRFPEHLDVLAIAVLLAAGTALLAGMYPATVLSRFRPVVVLKGGHRSAGEGTLLRKGLVVFQFALSVGMIISTLGVGRQLNYLMEKDPGFKREQMVVVDINSGDARNNFRAMKDEFGRIAGVEHVSSSSRVPGEWKNIPQVDVLPSAASLSTPALLSYFGIDEDFLSTFEIKLTHGRNFSSDLRTDSTAVLLNETAARMFGGSQVVGTELVLVNEVFAGQRTPLNMRVRVAGIVGDYHFRSLYEPIGPAVFGYWSNPVQSIDYFTISLKGRPAAEALPELRAVGEEYDPAHPFEFNILEDRWSAFYDSEERAGKVFTIASALSIIIACLGLFGLAAYATEQRTKEVGIRKVLGATSSSIVGQLSKEFVLLVAIGNSIAWPLTYVAMKTWLEGFAYRTSLGGDIFLIAGGVSVLIAFLSVAYRSVRAALANPVESLRYE